MGLARRPAARRRPLDGTRPPATMGSTLLSPPTSLSPSLPPSIASLPPAHTRCTCSSAVGWRPSPATPACSMPFPETARSRAAAGGTPSTPPPKPRSTRCGSGAQQLGSVQAGRGCSSVAAAAGPGLRPLRRQRRPDALVRTLRGAVPPPSLRSVLVAFCLGLPVLDSNMVFTAVTSIATIGLYISYVVPTLLRLTTARTPRRAQRRRSAGLCAPAILLGAQAADCSLAAPTHCWPCAGAQHLPPGQVLAGPSQRPDWRCGSTVGVVLDGEARSHGPPRTTLASPAARMGSAAAAARLPPAPRRLRRACPPCCAALCHARSSLCCRRPIL